MNFTSTDQLYSVSGLTRELKNLVEGKFRFVRVQGEISNLKQPFSGHSYFTLKDNSAQLKGVLFKGSARYLEQELIDGQQVVCHGRLSIYEPRGDYQLIVDSVDFKGAGLLQQRFEQLKNKLAAEGLFSAERKKALPTFPQKMLLLTSPSGAAVHDFLKIWRKRAFPCNITIFPVRVQGVEAAAEIATALLTVNREFSHYDMIVLCRGGGSLEDLWPFNEEILARAIARSTLPVISAIGHEIDYTISDFCADHRAATPTAAAEALIPDKKQLTEQLQRHTYSLSNSVYSLLENSQNRVNQSRRLLGDMDFLFTNVSLRLDHATEKLQTLIGKKIERCQIQTENIQSKLHNNSPKAKLNLKGQQLAFLTERLHFYMQNSVQDWQAKLEQHAALLDAVSPLATLARGYSISRKIDQKTGKRTVLHGSNELQKGDQVEVLLHRGVLECRVDKVLDNGKQ